MATDAVMIPLSHRTSNSTYSMPSPPRIAVPTLNFSHHSNPEIHLLPLKSATFLDGISYNGIFQENALLRWTYEQRRDAQAILPYLYLGPMTIAKDKAWLKEAEITCVISIRQKRLGASKANMDGAVRVADELGIEWHTLSLGSNAELIQTLPMTTALITQHLTNQRAKNGDMGKVLVSCESGNERSAAVVAAFVMETHDGIDHVKVMQIVQAQRFCVSFDEDLKALLQIYWDIVQARRAVDYMRLSDSRSSGDSIVRLGDAVTRYDTSSKGKRGLDRDHYPGEDSEEDDDFARFEGRNSAPFVDRTS